MHTYRDSDGPTRRALAVNLAGMVLIFPVVALTVSVFFVKDTWDTLRFYAWIFPLPILFAYLTYRHHSYGLCEEIRLSDDGTCELTTRRRDIRLHVNEIKSVKYQRDSEDESESYIIRYTDGKLTVRDRMTNFPDFLARLKALNPAVDLTSFPAEGWPPRRPARESAARLRLRSIVFPIVVVVILAWLAIETLTGG